MSERNQNDNDATLRALDAWTPMVPPPDFVDRVLAARAAPPVTRARKWWLAAPVAVAAMFALVLFFVAGSAKKESTSAEGVRLEAEPTAYETSASNAGSSFEPAAAGSAAGVAMNQPTMDAGVATQPPLPADPPPLEPAVRAGETVTIHDASPATRVQIVLEPACVSGATVTATSTARTVTARGVVRAELVLPAGDWTYIVECQSSVSATGTIRVIRDDARRALPEQRTQNDIEADGRTWRISYPSRIPNVRVRMPAGATGLTIGPDGGVAIDVPVKGGVAMVPSDKLSEGVYILFPEPVTRAWKKTTLIVDFDQAAPQLQIQKIYKTHRSAVDRRLTSSGLTVTGFVLPGWTLAIGGISVPVDARHRFTAKSHGSARVVIRAEHPAQGVHYYVTSPITP